MTDEYDPAKDGEGSYLAAIAAKKARGDASPIKREVVIGDCRLCATPLDAHVAGLTEAHEVIQRVGLSRCGKRSERADVVYRDGYADHFSALTAGPTVACDSRSACLKPSFSAVGSDAANPISGGGPGFVLRLEYRMAGFGAKAAARLGLVLPHQPRLYLELGSAVGAFMALASNKVHLASLFGGESIGWAKAFSPLVSVLVFVRHGAVSHVPNTGAPLTTKAGCFQPVRLNTKGARADFASHFNHLLDIVRSTDIAIACERIRKAYAQPDFFVPRAPEPKQEALL